MRTKRLIGGSQAIVFSMLQVASGCGDTPSETGTASTTMAASSTGSGGATATATATATGGMETSGASQGGQTGGSSTTGALETSGGMESTSGGETGELGFCEEEGLHEEILAAWDEQREYFRSLAQGSDVDPYNLYVVQILSNTLFSYAIEQGNDALVEDMLEVYLEAYATLDESDLYTFYYFPMSPKVSVHQLDRSYKMWLYDDGFESLIPSMQFLALVTQAIHHITAIAPSERSPLMNEFVDSFAPVVTDHYRRWILGVTVDGVVPEAGPFQGRGWGCQINGEYVETMMNHRTFTQKLLDHQLGDDSPCNAVKDTELWIYTGLARYLAANIADPSAAPLAQEDLDIYSSYLQTAMALLASRVTYEDRPDFVGEPASCAFFDLGGWDNHPALAFSGYTELSTFPDTSDNSPDRVAVSQLGWDVSHARRFVDAFRTLYELRDVLGFEFPTPAYMEAMASALAYVVFNGDFERPLFSTYMDGTDGWYRVAYNGEGFGYGPGDMSFPAITSGFGEWKKYNPDIEKVFVATYEMIHSADPSIRQHVIDRYETQFWQDFMRLRRFDLTDPTDRNTMLLKMMFYPSLCH